MAASKQNNDAGSIATESAYNISRTAPEELLRHDISDEQLGELGGMRRDHLWEGMWVALGVSLGVAPACMGILFNRYFKEPLEMISWGDQAQIIIFFVSAAVFGVLCIVMKSKSGGAKTIVTAIRERTKQRV